MSEPLLKQPLHPPIDFELLLASTLFVLSRATHSGEPHWPLAITHHLEQLIAHPQSGNGVLKRNLLQLHQQWTTQHHCNITNLSTRQH